VEGTEVLDVEPLGLVVEVVVLGVVAVVPVVVLRSTAVVDDEVAGEASSPSLPPQDDATDAATMRAASHQRTRWRRFPVGGSVTRRCLLGRERSDPTRAGLPPPRLESLASLAGEPTCSQSGGWSAS
jgi:hypothetical protein